MSGWRLARSLDVLRGELNTVFPDRDRTSDGTIGDLSHAANGSGSDHNAWLNNTVRAYDIDEDLDGEVVDGGADAEVLAEHFRLLGEQGDPRLANYGYVIYEGRIAGGNPNRGPDRWRWRPYTGPNAHKRHVHLSATRTPGPNGYDSVAPWGIAALFNPAPAPETPEDDMFTEDDRRKLDALYADYAVKGKGMRQVILETAERVKDLVTGKRPGPR